MSTETELRPQRSRSLPELDVEQDVDLRKYWTRLATHWWLPVAGLVLGLFVGYLLAQGSSSVYRAEAIVYLGQPFTPGGSPVQSLNTNPRTVGTFIHAESTIRRAARRSGLAITKLRNGVSSAPVSGVTGPTARVGQGQLYRISVKGGERRKVVIAANTLANGVINEVSGYVRIRIAAFQTRLESETRSLESVARRINYLNDTLAAAEKRNVSIFDRYLLVSQADNAEARRSGLLEAQTATQQSLGLANAVEKPRIFAPAVAVKTTARSTRNSMLVAGVIGLVLGALAALFADRFAGRLGRRRPS